MAILILFVAVIVLIVIFSILASYEESKTWEELRKQRMVKANERIDYHI